MNTHDTRRKKGDAARDAIFFVECVEVEDCEHVGERADVQREGYFVHTRHYYVLI